VRRWLHGAGLGAALALAPQAPTTLVEIIDRHPDFVLASPPDVHEDLESVFGDDLETALEYGVASVVDLDVSGPLGQTSLRLTEMIDSAAAFGHFASLREWEAPGYQAVVLGAEGYRTDAGTVSFWQGPYVVRLEGPPLASLALGRVLGDAITLPSRKPTVSMLLPAPGRVPDSEQYILTPTDLTERTGLQPDLLGFDSDVEVAVASYVAAGESASLVLLSYPTPQIARIHAEAWQADSGAAGASRRAGLLFGIVIGSTSTEWAASILEGLNSEFDITWSERPPDPLTIQGIILTAFTWIGIALAFTVVVGLGFGGLRIFLKTRYPHSPFGGGGANDFVQLHIDQSVNRNRLPD
jgi:hypothetical protein